MRSEHRLVLLPIFLVVCLGTLVLPVASVRAGNGNMPEVRLSLSASDFNAICSAGEHDPKVIKSCTVAFRYPGEGSDRFSVGAQIRNHGACAVHEHTNKKSFRLKFKAAYGPKRLYYPVFERAPVHATTKQGFDNIVLRGGANDSPQFTLYDLQFDWTYCMDEFVRATQIDMSGIGNHGTFCTLYVNGTYWGLYNMTERADRAFAGMWISGNKDDWVSYRDQEGSLSRWWTAYNRACNAQSYSINDISPYLDLEAFADYMILGMTAGTWDWSLANSWNVTHKSGKTYFFMWDAEHSFAGVYKLDMVGHKPQTDPARLAWSSHEAPHLDMFFGGLIKNSAFKQIFSDRARLHLKTSGGALTDTKMLARWNTITSFVSGDISRDTGKWGSSWSKWNSNIQTVRNLISGNANEAFNAFSAKGWIVAPSAQPPTAPSGLVATAQSSSQIRVTWQDNSGSEEAYKLDRRVSGSSSWVRVVQTGANDTSHTDSGLSAATTYYYKVKAWKTDGGDSAYSNVDDATTDPELVPQIAISPSTISVSCEVGQSPAAETFDVWNSGTGTLAYNVTENSSLLSVSPASGTSTGSSDVDTHTVTFSTAALAAGIYDRTITIEDNGSGAANSPVTIDVQITVSLSLPAAPSALVASAVGQTAIDVTWQDNSDNEEVFKLDRRQSGATTWTRAFTSGSPGVSSYGDSGLAPGTKYYYKVKAYNSSGESAYSNIDAATTDPELVPQIAVSPNTISVSCELGQSPAAETFDVWNSGTGTLAYNVTENSSLLSVSPASGTSTGSSDVQAHTLTFSTAALAVGTHNRTITIEDNGSGAANSPVTIDVQITVSLSLPAAPSALTASVVGQTEIDVSWQDNSDNEERFKLDRRQSGTTSWVRAFTSGAADVSSYGDSGLAPGTKYYYKVKAYNSSGESAYSNVDDATTDPELVPQIAVSPNTISVSCELGQSPAAETFDVWNSGTGTLAYNVTDNSSMISVSPASGTSAGSSDAQTHTITFSSGAAPAGVYDRTITIEDNGSGAANSPVTIAVQITITEPTAPPAPSGLAAAALSSSEIGLTWNDVADEDEYEIARSPDGTDWTTLAPLVVGADVVTATDSGLDAGTTYYYKIRAKNAVGASPYSATVSATTEPGPLGPFTAYNDLLWVASEPTQNITLHSQDDAGNLVDHATGTVLPAQLSVTGGTLDPAHGAAPATGTDGYQTFAGKVGLAGLIAYSATDLTLAFTGLDPALRYEVVVFGNRDNPAYTDRITKVRLSGHAGFVNASTPGSDFDGPADGSTAIVNGYNTVNGFVARFKDVDPAADGAFNVIVYDNDSVSAPKFYASAVMLRGYHPTPSQTPIPNGATWRYRKGTAEPAGAWRLRGYDDAGWATGAAPFGYGDGPYGTELTDMEDSYSTVYLRRDFDLALPAEVGELQLNTTYDDGFVVWLNGVEIARVNVAGTPGQPPVHTGLASATVNNGTAWAQAWSGGALPELRESNTLAVMLLNADLSSSDLTFDAELSLVSAQWSATEDTDQNGMPDDWEQEELAGLSDPSEHADPDGDGLLNIEEYILGCDPGVAEAWLSVDVKVVAGQIEVSFPTKQATGTGYVGKTRYYALQQCNGSAGPGLWTAVAGMDRIAGNGATVTHAAGAGADGMLLRVRVWLE